MECHAAAPKQSRRAFKLPLHIRHTWPNQRFCLDPHVPDRPLISQGRVTSGIMGILRMPAPAALSFLQRFGLSGACGTGVFWSARGAYGRSSRGPVLFLSFFQVPVFGSWPLDHSVQFIHPVFVRCDHSRNVCRRLTCATARAVAPHAAFAACVLHASVWYTLCSKVWSKCFFDRVAAFSKIHPGPLRHPVLNRNSTAWKRLGQV